MYILIPVADLAVTDLGTGGGELIPPCFRVSMLFMLF
jgi:hypothetical protein